MRGRWGVPVPVDLKFRCVLRDRFLVQFRDEFLQLGRRTFKVGAIIGIDVRWAATTVSETAQCVNKRVGVNGVDDFQMQASYSEAREDSNPPFQLLSPLLDDGWANQVDATMTERWLIHCCTTLREICHVWELSLSTSHSAEETVSDDLIDDDASTQYPILLPCQGEHMLGSNVAVASVNVFHEKFGHVMFPW